MSLPIYMFKVGKFRYLFLLVFLFHLIEIRLPNDDAFSATNSTNMLNKEESNAATPMEGFCSAFNATILKMMHYKTLVHGNYSAVKIGL